MVSSTFFDLCPDVLFELFVYFSLNELFDVFGEVIPSLANLLNQSHMRFFIDQNANDEFWNGFAREMNSNQILAIENSCAITNLSAFAAVRSMNLTVHSPSLFDEIQSLNHLEILGVQLPETIFDDQTWLSQILILPKLKKLKLGLISSQSVLMPQPQISIDKSTCRSRTIECLEMKLPMSWSSLFSFLVHFPHLKIFRASLYRCDASLRPRLNLSSLQTLDLQGYILNMSTIISVITSRMRNLQYCRLIALNVTNDDAFEMQHASIWRDLVQSCSDLIRLRIHFLMSIERNECFDRGAMKDLLRTFNHHSFCEKYHFQMEQLSINRGYVTLTGDYQKERMQR